MKAAIVIDNFKYEVFTRRLSQAGYTFTEGSLGAHTTLLSVETDNTEALAEVVKAAQTECAFTGERQ